MKKILVSMCAVVLYFIIFTHVEAAGTVSLSASKTTVDVGETFNVSINLSGASVATLTARVNFDTQKVDFVSGPSNSNFSGGRVIYTWTDATGGSAPLTGGTIATFTFKAKSAGSVNFSVSGNFFSPEETSVNPSFSGVVVTVKEVESISPGGSETGGNQTGGSETGGNQTGGNQTGGNQTGENQTGGNQTGGNQTGGNQTGGNQTGGNQTGGNQTGGNQAGGNQTGGNQTGGTQSGGSQSGNNNQSTKSSNNNLKTLQLDVEGINPIFNKKQTQYYISILENISQININAIPEDEKAKVEIIGNNNISVGNSVIKIIVIAENGNKKEYIINVTKANNLEITNANLENLAIENYTLVPEFDTNIIEYTVEIPADVATLNILAIPQKENATVTIQGNENLQVGDNLIKISVVAADGTTSKEYNILVKKQEVVEEENIEDNIEEEDNEISNIDKEEIDEEIEKKSKIRVWLIIGGVLLIVIPWGRKTWLKINQRDR